MGTKKQNVTQLEKSSVLGQDASVKDLASLLINNKVLNKAGLTADKVKGQKDQFIQFLAGAFSSTATDVEQAAMAGFWFLKKSKNKADVKNFVLNVVSLATELATTLNETEDKTTKKLIEDKLDKLSPVLVAVDQKIEGMPEKKPKKKSKSIPTAPPLPKTETQSQGSVSQDQSQETATSTKDKPALEKELRPLGDEAKLAQKFSETGKEAFSKYNEVANALKEDEPDIASVESTIAELKKLIEVTREIEALVDRASDLKDEAAVILKSNSTNRAGIGAKSVATKAISDLKGKSPDLNSIGLELDDADRMLAENDEEDGEPLMGLQDLKAWLTKAAKADGSKSFPFACCVDGKNSGGDLTVNGFTFVIHKKKKSAALMRNLKREIDSAKLKHGMLTVEKKSKTIVLDVKGELGSIPKIAKLMKLWLKARKPLPVKKARILDIDGSEVSVGFEDGELKELLVDYAKRVTTATSNFLDYASNINDVWKKITVVAGRANDFENISEFNADNITRILTDLDNILDKAEDNKKWKEVEAEIDRSFELNEDYLDGKEKPPYWDKLKTVWAVAKAAAEKGDYSDGLTIAVKVKSTLLSIMEGSLTGNDDAQTRWEKASGNWSKTISSVLEQIDTLKQELMKFNDVELKEIAQFELNALFLDYVNRITKAFNNVSKLDGSPAMQANLAGDALDIVIEFKKHMLGNEKVKIVERFGASAFDSPVSIKGPLTTAFNELQPALVLLQGVAS